ncbi:hypothetical protein [Salipiger mangrovisoli]|uniref:Glycosyltransferase family 1 protein n=1 Tax=Salipiger mangrovisoli TaxID=2865933 RepID=A0ABR9X8R0_9RHOB|nr:hypothetical protein [Salipiger mangrovisoli]MBE9639943.1 hypothetical protein [Salipiger mangrovisoli]
MKINVCHIGNREWLDFKADIAYGLLFALEELGHDVVMRINNFEQNRLNIIIGADFLAASEDTVRQIRGSTIDYAIFEVENFDGATINQRPNFPLSSYTSLVEGARFVITPYLANLSAYAGVCDAAKIRYARWGFYEQLRDPRIVRRKDFDFEALFFGLLKGSRAEKVDRLVNTHGRTVKILGRNDPLTVKDYFVATCKWGLNLSYGASEKFINPFRLYYMAANGMPILADPGADQDGYLGLCEVVGFEHLPARLDDAVIDADTLAERCRAHSLSQNLKAVL